MGNTSLYLYQYWTPKTTRPMNILIIEDEPRAANQLKSMLVELAVEFKLLDILDTVEDTIKWFDTQESPDLIFMDVQLADGISFEIFHSVDIDSPIIFTTAFDQYAIQAFKVNSVDYLLKPINKKELKSAIDKYYKSNKPTANQADVLKQLLQNIQEPKKRQGILVKDGNGFVQIKVSDLLYIYSEDSLTFGVTEKKRYIIDETLDKLFGTLEKEHFFKINRGQIISKTSVLKIQPYFNHRVKLAIQKARDLEFIVSRPKTSEFKEWMNK